MTEVSHPDKCGFVFNRCSNGFLISFFLNNDRLLARFLQMIQGVGVHTTVSVRVHDANIKSNANIVTSTAG